MSSDTVAPFAAPAWRWKTVLSVLGPGVVVMLADTEVGSIVTAAQSGARWGYQLLLLQFLLIPVLYVVQELTVRLGLSTGKGHAELIRETFGTGWAWVSVGGLAVACLGALVTEFSGVAAVGELFGVPRTWSLSLATAALLAVTMTGSYRRVERVALTLGAFEFVFFLGAVAANPDGRAMVSGLAHAPVGNPSYLYLVAANIGAVIMPWMIFYQQSAVVDKRLRPEHYAAARWDTAIRRGPSTPSGRSRKPSRPCWANAWGGRSSGSACWAPGWWRRSWSRSRSPGAWEKRPAASTPWSSDSRRHRGSTRSSTL